MKKIVLLSLVFMGADSLHAAFAEKNKNVKEKVGYYRASAINTNQARKSKSKSSKQKTLTIKEIYEQNVKSLTIKEQKKDSKSEVNKKILSLEEIYEILDPVEQGKALSHRLESLCGVAKKDYKEWTTGGSK